MREARFHVRRHAMGTEQAGGGRRGCLPQGSMKVFCIPIVMVFIYLLNMCQVSYNCIISRHNSYNMGIIGHGVLKMDQLLVD